MEKKLAILVHGLGTSYTDRSVLDDLIPNLSSLGFDVVQFRYGFLSVIGAIFSNHRIAKRLHSVIQSSVDFYDHILVIGHSNGCTLMDIASNTLHNTNKKVGYVYISPATGVSKAPGDAVSWLDVWFNPSDSVIKFIRFLMSISVIMHWSKWGLMGIYGYQGADPRVTNFELDADHLGWHEQHGAFFHSLHSHLEFFKERVKQKFIQS